LIQFACVVDVVTRDQPLPHEADGVCLIDPP
jgi:hypothetical protein